jgi:hypothetical protein
MSKLKTKADVIEWYWPDYLYHCIQANKSENPVYWTQPTEDGFWKWYITKNVGPLAIKVDGKWYSKEDVEYV